MPLSFNTGVYPMPDDELSIDFESDEPVELGSPYVQNSSFPLDIYSFPEETRYSYLIVILQKQNGKWIKNSIHTRSINTWESTVGSFLQDYNQDASKYIALGYSEVAIKVHCIDIIKGDCYSPFQHHQSFKLPTPKNYVNGPKANKEFLIKKSQQWSSVKTKVI